MSDLGRVSYHAYWKSVVLEYLHTHRSDVISLTDISKETGMYCHDIATALQLLNFMRYIPTENGPRLRLCVDWKKVDQHAERVAKSKTRISIDPECLRWTPLLTPTVNPFRIEEKSSGDENGTDAQEKKEPVLEIRPEKVVIDMQQGVKVVKKGRKRRTTITTPKQPKEDTAVQADVEDNTTIEVTSSGRRRTRPKKYNETTFEDIKVRPHVNNETPKRKRTESAVSNSDKDTENDKKKTKAETPAPSPAVKNNRVAAKTPKAKLEMKKPEPKVEVETPRNKRKDMKSTVKSSEAESDVPNSSEPAVVNNRSRRGVSIARAKPGERWSQRREKRLKPTETEESTEAEQMPELKPEHDAIGDADISTSAPPLSPQVKKATEVKQRAIKKKRGWVKGRARRSVTQNQKKQVTLPELLKKTTAAETTTDTEPKETAEPATKQEEKPVDAVAEKNDTLEISKGSDEAKSPLSKPETANSSEEDSCAEADDEMEADERDYKITPKVDRSRFSSSWKVFRK